jgi:hypothetical protein
VRVACITTLLLLLAVPVAAQDPASTPAQDQSEEGFVPLFDGKTLDGWQGATDGYAAEDGKLVCLQGGNLYTKRECADFIFRFEFKLPPMGNNGVGIRTPPSGNPAYGAMEIQILDDNYKDKYPQLQPYQVHGSIYGVVPADPGHQKPIGQWNSEEIMAKGSHVRVTLNGVVIVDADLDKIDKPMDGREHPGLHNKSGHIGFLGHGARIEFRNLRIKEL